MQRLGSAAAALLQAHRSLAAGIAVQQQVTPALLQKLSSCLFQGTAQQAAAHHSWESQQWHQQHLQQPSGTSNNGCKSFSLGLPPKPWGSKCSTDSRYSRSVSTTSSSSSSASGEVITSPLTAAPLIAATAESPATQQQVDKPAVIQGICRRKNVKSGWKKLDFVLRMVRRSYVDDAMAQLANNPKKAAVFVMHAVANARNNAIVAGGDPAKLWVSEAYVTKGKYQKRLEFMSKGCTGIKETRHSHLNVKVRQLDEKDPLAAKMLRQKPKLIAPLTNRLQRSRSKRSQLRQPSGQRLFAAAVSA